MPLARKAPVVILGLLAAAVTVSCGGEGGNAPAAQPSPPKAAPANVVHQTDLQGIPLGTPKQKILSMFGEPVGRPSTSKQSCLIYQTDAGPDTWQRFCFVNGKLANIGTVIGRQNALTLDPPLPKGPGKLRHPTVIPPASK